MLIVVFWLFGFALALVPGVVIGWLIGRYRPSRLVCLLLAVAIGIWMSNAIYPDPNPKSHVANLVGFLPPILLALLLGHRFGRKRRERKAGASLRNELPEAAGQRPAA